MVYRSITLIYQVIVTQKNFSPPLPYFILSLIDSICDKTNELNIINLNCTLCMERLLKRYIQYC